jgi:hypothetical protein
MSPFPRTRIAGILSLGLVLLGAPGAMASGPRPDAEIRIGNGQDVGDGVYSPIDQAVSGTGTVGDKLTFWITIGNDGFPADSFKVKRSGFFHFGYRVRYYDASGSDVTGKVNVGSFTTPSLENGEKYVMRATVKIRSAAPEDSIVTRQITVSSVLYPSIKDTVRFTAALNGVPNLTVSPGETDDGIFYDFVFGIAPSGVSQVFTLSNGGTGPTDVLGFNISGSGFALGTDTCTGAVLAANGTCSFRVEFVPPPGCDLDPFIQLYQVSGGIPPTTAYFDLYTRATCPPVF